MRKTGTVLVLVGLTLLCLPGTASPGTGVADDIRRTTDALLQGGAGGPGDVHTTLRHLLDIASDLGREGRLPAPAQTRLDAAVAEARRLSPLDSAVRVKVEEAYAALDGGRPFTFPKEIESIEDARTYGREQADRSLAALSADRPLEAARELVGLVALVITPMEKPR